ncbi:class I tRNA ligase family protein [Cellulosimicrobium cellulans]|uniref:class I tRNA ligase family protein n=1 Tax=Cellulosimicrobium cellulans TaxID=1710 RepID=UPI003817CD40
MRYAILPMQPTPNGRMHIGHGGGTYLRADALARALRADGHDVRVGCGSDSYENWVLAAAALEGRAAESVCAENDAGIREDLESLGIEVDVWVDPLSPEFRESYVSRHGALFRELQKSSRTRLVEESVPYSDLDGRPMMGTFIAGHCPSCGKAAGGSSCTSCGQHFQPEELRDARSRLDGASLTWRTVKSWFIMPGDGDDVLGALARQGVDPRELEVIAAYLARTPGRVRVSGPGTWGIPSADIPSGQVLSNTYYAYCVYVSSLLWPEDDDEPFDSSSTVRTIGVFGTDNTVPGVLVPELTSAASERRLKPFDHVVVNGMLDLDGRKCSTSQRYGIWLRDVLGRTMSSDELRFALAGLDLDGGRSNLATSTLLEDVRVYRELVLERVRRVAQSVAGEERVERSPDASLVDAQRRALGPERVVLPVAREVLVAHLRSDTDDPHGWLATARRLCAPLVPDLAGALALPPGEVVRHVEAAVAREPVSKELLEKVIQRGSGR